jgi:hypothetical protein
MAGGSPVERETPSLRLKGGYARDDAAVRRRNCTRIEITENVKKRIGIITGLAMRCDEL